MNRLEFKKNDPKVERLVRLCYPSYKGRRTVKVEARQTYRVSDYWDGGSRDYVEFFHLPTSRVVRQEQVEFEKQERGNPYGSNMGTVKLTPEIAVVENCIFRGKDMGIRIYVCLESLEQFR